MIRHLAIEENWSVDRGHLPGKVGGWNSQRPIVWCDLGIKYQATSPLRVVRQWRVTSAKSYTRRSVCIKRGCQVAKWRTSRVKKIIPLHCLPPSHACAVQSKLIWWLSFAGSTSALLVICIERCIWHYTRQLGGFNCWTHSVNQCFHLWGTIQWWCIRTVSICAGSYVHAWPHVIFSLKSFEALAWAWGTCKTQMCLPLLCLSAFNSMLMSVWYNSDSMYQAYLVDVLISSISLHSMMSGSVYTSFVRWCYHFP